ncbi:hypothetical protein KR009_009921, partial [Drosophila setifemur]
NCSLPAILEFPNLMRRKSIGWTVLCIFLSLYLFVALAIVCDDYLVPAMERLCYTLRMTYDVAGATFLAAATSAPELFVNFVGTFVTRGDIGLGTIVGSSVFNVLMITSICGLFTAPTKLDWWPVTRDALWYLFAILALAVVLLDSHIIWYESVALLLMYLIYLLLLIFDRRIQSRCRKVHVESELMDEDPLTREEEPLKGFREHLCDKPKPGSKCCTWLWFVIKYPAELFFALTVPSVRTMFFFLSMVVAVIFISVITYLLTWFLTLVGYNIGIPDSIMGLTVLAAGTSVPEVAASYIVSKKGYGSMAICNALGSNTFDILVCLALPWLLKNVIFSSPVYIDSSALIYTTSMLVIALGLVYITILSTRFVVGKVLGWISLFSYVIFLVVASTLELLLHKTTICNIED